MTNDNRAADGGDCGDDDDHAREVDGEAADGRGFDERHADDERQQHETEVEAALVEDAADRRARPCDCHGVEDIPYGRALMIVAEPRRPGEYPRIPGSVPLAVASSRDTVATIGPVRWWFAT